MVGVINAPAYSEPFTAFFDAAKAATVVNSASTTELSSTSPSPSSPNSSPSSSSTTRKTQTAATVGGVVGGVVILFILVVVIFVWCRRRIARRVETERLTSVSAFPAGPDIKEEMERLKTQVQRLETERRLQGRGGTGEGSPTPEGIQGPATETLVHVDSGLRVGPGRVIEELPPRYIAE